MFELPPLPLPELPLPPDPEPPLPEPLPELALSDTAIWSDFCFEAPFKSETITENANVPLELGVPESFPVLLLRSIPPGNCPEVTANL